MNDTTTEASMSKSTSPSTALIIYIGAACAGACVIIAIVIIVCVIRKRRHPRIPVHLPNPWDIDLQPGIRSSDHRQNQDVADPTRELPALPPVASERAPEPIKIVLSASPICEARNTDVSRSPNYQNVHLLRFSIGDQHNGDNDGDDDCAQHDYENNPIERRKFEEEQQKKRGFENKNSRAHTLQTGIEPIQHFKNDKKNHSFHPTSHANKLSSNSGGSMDWSSPATSAGHSPRIKGYVNTSQSLESLDKRTVPQPPSLLLNPVIKVPSIGGHCSPPKAHVEKSKGYVNQPA